jgi:hypothetical protein
MMSWHRGAIRFSLLLLVAAGPIGCGDSGSGGGPETGPPDVQRIVAVPPVVARGGSAQLTALASDPDGDSLAYAWSASAGSFSEQNRARIRWTAPAESGTYRVSVVVSDRDGADSTSLDIPVGSGSIRILSDPPGASVYLNAVLQNGVTPIVYNGLPVGEYNVQLASSFFQYAPLDIGVTIGDGDSALATFHLPAAREEIVDTGPVAMDEIGGLTYTSGGIGIVYLARIGNAVTLRSASLVPTHLGTNGVVLFEGGHLEEPMSLRVVPFDWAELAFVTNDDIHVGRLVDTNFDGLHERLDNPRRMSGTAGSTYAPAWNAEGTRMAFAVQPSTPPNNMDLLIEGDYDSVRVLQLRRVSARGGNSPSYGARGEVIFEASGELYEAFVDPLDPVVPRQLTNTGGFAFAPAVSPNGKYVAYVDSRGRIMLYVPELDATTMLKSDAATHRVAWSPDGRELILGDNRGPGQARVILIGDMPIF